MFFQAVIAVVVAVIFVFKSSLKKLAVRLRLLFGIKDVRK